MVSVYLRRGWCVAALTLGIAIAPASAQARDGVPTLDTVAAMHAGDFVWNRAGPTPGGVRIVVSIADQKLYVYRAATLVAVSSVSTGKTGHETPVGEFTILQKKVDHTSNRYDDAPMPYMQRITWDGVAIHAGRDPGYAASHGCMRVPIAFAKRLYAVTRLGAQVLITDESILYTLPGPDETPVQSDAATPDMMGRESVPVATAYAAERPRG